MTAKILKRRGGGGGGYYNADGVTLKVENICQIFENIFWRKKQISTTQVSCSSGFSLNLPKTKVRCGLLKKMLVSRFCCCPCCCHCLCRCCCFCYRCRCRGCCCCCRCRLNCHFIVSLSSDIHTKYFPESKHWFIGGASGKYAINIKRILKRKMCKIQSKYLFVGGASGNRRPLSVDLVLARWNIGPTIFLHYSPLFSNKMSHFLCMQ